MYDRLPSTSSFNYMYLLQIENLAALVYFSVTNQLD